MTAALLTALLLSGLAFGWYAMGDGYFTRYCLWHRLHGHRIENGQHITGLIPLGAKRCTCGAFWLTVTIMGDREFYPAPSEGTAK